MDGRSNKKLHLSSSSASLETLNWVKYLSIREFNEALSWKKIIWKSIVLVVHKIAEKLAIADCFIIRALFLINLFA